MATDKARILKVAGLSLFGFCAVSIGVDRANVGPLASQVAGFTGALLGGLAAHRRARAGAKLPAPPPDWAEQFRRDGYIVFPQLVPLPLIETARARIAESLTQGYDESKLVEYNNRSWYPELCGAPAMTNLLKNDAVLAILDAALGKRNYRSSRGQIAIRQAHNASQSSEPVPHIDGIPTPHNGLAGTELQSFTALVGIFLTEVKREFAGNFTVWPGSHITIAKHFQERDKKSLNNGMPDVPLGTPVQLLAKPGDVVLCHYELAHAAAVNTSDDDRIAVFFRVSFKSILGPHHREERWRHLTNPWTGWKL